MKTKSRLTSGQTMIFIAGALFCLMLISVSLLSGLYARYISTGSGDDTARVAKFDVATTVPNVNAKFVNKGAQDNIYTIEIDNDSEVAVRCDLVLEFNSAVEYLNITVGGKAPSEISSDKKTFTFKDIALLAPNGAIADCQLVFTVTDWNSVTANATGETVQISYNFDGTLYCTQID